MSHSPAPKQDAIERGLSASGLVDLLQRRIGSHGLQSVRIDVSAAVHAGRSVLLEQAEPDQTVNGRAAHTLAGGCIVDRDESGHLDQILPVQVTSSLQRCIMATTKLRQSEYLASSLLIHY